MVAAGEQELSHADRHDLDKLARWREGLDGAADGSASGFPACAIFLVGPEHRASHDIFRRYRSVFEELGGGFHHLVIFGQHGVSTTQVAFLSEVGMEQGSVPLLVIAPMADGTGANGEVYCLELPKGERDGEPDETQSWGAALGAVRDAADGKGQLSLEAVSGEAVSGEAVSGEAVSGVRTVILRHGSLSAAVAGVQGELNGG